MLDSNFDVEKILSELSALQKCRLLAGSNGFSSGASLENGLPAMRMSDGPQGPRGPTVHNATPSNCFPSAIALGASFDRQLVAEIATQYVQESKAKKSHVLLAPTVNLVRGPQCGRGFEFFGEDPFLAGQLAIPFVQKVQEGNVATCLKHFVGNEQEYEKHNSDSVISPRALREIYLEPFRMVIKEANPWSIMSAYNKINGVTCSENKWLLDEVLRKEWKYDGAVISDWYGVHDPAGSIIAGCDIEMPGKPFYRNTNALMDLLGCEKITQQQVDDRARAMLTLFKRTTASNIPYDDETMEIIDTPASRSLLRKSAAASVVLLKNDQGLLPLSTKAYSKIAVIGSTATMALSSGGGAASTPYEVFQTTPLIAIQEQGKELGIVVDYAPGVLNHLYSPELTPNMRHPDTKEMHRAKIEFWKESPSPEWTSATADVPTATGPDHAFESRGTRCFISDGVPEDIIGAHYVKLTTDFVPPHGGDWAIGLTAGNSGHVFVDGKLLIDYAKDLENGTLFFNYCHKEKKAVLKNVEAGRAYRIEYRCWPTDHHFAFTVLMSAGFQLGAAPAIAEQDAIDDAVGLAKKSDLTIVVVGLGKDFETEGMDRDDIDLPGASNQLVEALLKATSNVVVVTQSGLPITMPWIDQAPTIVHQFYGGSDVGHGLSDVLFGKVNPSGKLPVTFPKRLLDSPSSLGFGKGASSWGRAYYQEDIYIGHRYFDRAGLAPLFPFGHGLSYTSFEYSDLVVSIPSGEKAAFEVSLSIKNTGSVVGQETALLFVRDVQCDVARPLREFKGFDKVEIAPGEKRKINIQLDKNALKYWDDRKRHAWVAEAGDFEISVGPSSVTLPLRKVVHLDQTVVWRGL